METKEKIAKDKSQIVSMLPSACSDERKAVEFIEDLRWGGKPQCPHCESLKVYAMRKRGSGERSERFLWRCNECGQQFTVRIGTIFEDSRIPMRHWCFAFWAACAGKKGVSALQIKRQTGLSYKSALFMMHRIRFAMGDDISSPRKLKGTVETDETYVGGKPRHVRPHNRYGIPSNEGFSPRKPKAAVLGMVERGGEVRAVHLAKVNRTTVEGYMVDCISKKARLMTDEWKMYKGIGEPFKSHGVVKHSLKQYVKGKDTHTNTAEGFFSILKRALYGTWHSVSKKHLHRYVAEVQFRYNTRHDDDGERVRKAINKGVGKRLTYREQIA